MIEVANEPSLAEELPYWDFVHGERAHVVLSDGSLVSGLELSLIDIECFDDRAVNNLTNSVRSCLNSISEDVTIQFHLSVDSDFKKVLEVHQKKMNPDSHNLIKQISEYRLNDLKVDLEKGSLYHPVLYVYLKVPLPHSGKISVFKKKKDFEIISEEKYQEALEILSQNLDTLCSSFSSLGLNSRILQSSEMVGII